MTAAIEPATEADAEDLLALAHGGESHRFSPVHLMAGERLFDEGDEADALYLVLSGRLRAGRGPEGLEYLADVGPGGVVGEVGLLGRGRRTATVTAVRDSDLLRLEATDFDELATTHPAALRALSRRAAGLVARPTSSAGPDIRTIALVPCGRTASDLLAEVGTHLTDALRSLGPALRVERGHLDLDRLETTHRYLVLDAGAEATAWAAACLRQADQVVLVGDASNPPALGGLEELAIRNHRPGRAGLHLVLVHPEHTELPSGTASWLRPRPDVVHHNVRRGSHEHYGRVARALVGRSIGLVLGGGGARGFSHLGVMQAMDDARLPVDAVGGTSIGSIMGALLAMGWDHETRLAKAHRAFTTKRLLAPTLPVIAYSSSRTLTRLLQDSEFCGSTDIEDLWLPFFAVSANLTRSEEHVHRTGPLWQAIRASISLPGILPPVCLGDDLLVDGSVLNDVPVDLMRASLRGRVVAVDLGPPSGLRATTPFDCTLSGWRVLANRLSPFRAGTRAPSAVSVLLKSKDLAARRAAREQLAGSAPDVHLRPPAGGVDLLDFRSGLGLVTPAYEDARAHLDSFRDVLVDG